MPPISITVANLDDFYEFAVGSWLKNNPIPAEYPMWGSFVTLADKNEQALHITLEAAETNKTAATGSNEQKIGDFYASCMDTKEIDVQNATMRTTTAASAR
ncbi:MAG TPA: M13 family metallopeptidase N-terminal domain-containing protein [Candidatus Acidoferrum sp.]|nr:M13 family metallopeptidase N-terminal domain-containing protein [Candidatus Acidoferrum sp.]